MRFWENIFLPIRELDGSWLVHGICIQNEKLHRHHRNCTTWWQRSTNSGLNPVYNVLTIYTISSIQSKRPSIYPQIATESKSRYVCNIHAITVDIRYRSAEIFTNVVMSNKAHPIHLQWRKSQVQHINPTVVIRIASEDSSQHTSHWLEGHFQTVNQWTTMSLTLTTWKK